MTLKKIGYYKEMPHGEANDPSIRDIINALDQIDEIDNICSYLDDGKPIVVCCGTSQDVINPEKGIAGIPSVLTDGVWVWPGDLSYYVRNYHIGIDHDFLNHMRENNWSISFNPDNIENEHVSVDGITLW